MPVIEISLFVILAALLIRGADDSAAIAVASWTWIYLIGDNIWQVTGYPIRPDGHLDRELYSAVLSAFSFAQILVYTTLPSVNRWIIFAAFCELALIAYYLTLAAGSGVAWVIRPAVVDTLNLAALAALTGGWGHGRTGRRRRVDPVARRLAADRGAPHRGRLHNPAPLGA